MAWIAVFRPTPEEVQQVADSSPSSLLALEDTLSGHQRSKLERYGENLFVVLRPELHWAIGYPMALALMAATSVTLYVVFRKKRWL
ncbi:hypothetical protein NQ152_11455 [Microbacterium sp. zg.B48]|uniref:hypothetical protein n=1 Tax=Microbacterium sp. zg.B48 TaxID=2969408 RepID=UPI00214CDD9F|nr:hypothetical protein [Microbacterium sp. zg.B48]MCR2764120.1 hypothetical protein [Microbacterium sp. zg.B48]